MIKTMMMLANLVIEPEAKRTLTAGVFLIATWMSVMVSTLRMSCALYYQCWMMHRCWSLIFFKTEKVFVNPNPCKV